MRSLIKKKTSAQNTDTHDSIWWLCSVTDELVISIYGSRSVLFAGMHNGHIHTRTFHVVSASWLTPLHPTPPIPSTAHTFKLAFALCFVEQTHTGSQGTPARSGLVSGSGMWTASRNHTLPSLPSHPFADFPLFHSQSAENVNKRFLWKVVFFDTNDEAAAS